MAFENLLKSIDESAQERERELREKAGAAAEAIIQEAQDQAAAIRQAHLDQAQKSASIERHRSLYVANSEEKKNLIHVQETLFGRAFDIARQNLAKVRQDSKYPQILTRLVREAVDMTGTEHFKVHVDERDEALTKKILAQAGLPGEVVPDITCTGGVVVTTADNLVTISNTIESRLERIREHRKLEIYAILNGD
jgi:vacuolar-type H+-ATPase subunit E/Vma4